MKVSRSVFWLLAISLLAATSALASQTTKEPLHLNENVMLAGHTLRSGDYHVEWEGQGPSVTVSILQGDRVVAEAPARIMTQRNKEEQSGYITRAASNGAKTLTGLLFSGKDYWLQFSAPQQGSSASGSGR
jgi:hypothetical protein